MYVLGAQKNRLIETILLSTHNMCFGLEIRKLNFRYTLLTKVLCINAIQMRLSIIYLKGLQVVKSPNIDVLSVPVNCFDLSKKCRP